MKPQAGFTVLELLVTVSILTALAGISLISIAAPSRLMEKEAILSQIERTLEQAELTALIKGKSVQVAFTPWALWVNDKKAVEFEPHGYWQWQTEIQSFTLLGGKGVEIIDQKGHKTTLPQSITLHYNQNRVVLMDIHPQIPTIRILKDASR